MKLTTLVVSLMMVSGVAHADLNDFGKGLSSQGDKISKSHKNLDKGGLLETPVQTVAGHVTTVAGNTVKYVGNALSLLQTEGGEQYVEAYVDSGACVAQAHADQHMGQFVACGVEVGGRYLSITVDLAAQQGGNLVYMVTEMGSDLFQVWEDAFMACASALGEENWYKYLRPCSAIAFTFNKAGLLVRATGVSIGDTVIAVGKDAEALVTDTIDIPVSLLRLDPKSALKSLGFVVRDIVCIGFDIVLVIPRVLSHLTGGDNVKACLDYATGN